MRPHRGRRRGRLLRASLCVCVSGGSCGRSGRESHARARSSIAVAVKGVEVLCVVCDGEADAGVRSEVLSCGW